MTNNLESLLSDINGVYEDQCDDPDWKDEELLKVDLHVSVINIKLVNFVLFYIVAFNTIYD